MRFRTSLTFLVACFAALYAAADSFSLEYPVKPVQLVVGFQQGSTPDLLARMVGAKLGERWGQPVLVANRPGAGGIVAYGGVAASAADGYTLLLAATGIAINVSLYKNLPYDPVRDFAPITLVALTPYVLVVRSSLPVASVKELIALAKSKPGGLAFGSAGSGTSPHLAGVMFNTLSGIEVVHVPYKGSMPALTDLLGGRTAFMFLDPPLALTHLKSGKLRALGMTAAKRASWLPDIPTVAEVGLPGYEIVSWFGLLAPSRTSGEIVDKVHQDTVSILNTPEIQARMLELGVELVGNTPAQFAARIKSDMVRMGKVWADSGGRAD